MRDPHRSPNLADLGRGLDRAGRRTCGAERERLARGGVEALVTRAPRIEALPRFKTVEQALETRPMHFTELMATLGSNDGREIVVELEALRESGRLDRGVNGEWSLKKEGS